MSRIVSFLKKKDVYLGVVRYALGLTMVPYGLTKILKTQFILYPLSIWQQPLEKLSGISLTWAFLGYSQWFEVLLGFFELIPALLLLFRRTTLTGALLLLPVSLNVFLINFAFDLWFTTQHLSLILLILNILVLLFEWRKMREVAITVFGRIKLKFTLAELAVNMILVGVVGWIALNPILDYRKQKNFLTGDWLHRRPAEWILKGERKGDSALNARNVKAYFGAYGYYAELKDGAENNTDLKYELHPKDKTIHFYSRKTGAFLYKGTYHLNDDFILILSHLPDGDGGKALTQIYHKRIINEPESN